jgi:hypothetical protein
MPTAANSGRPDGDVPAIKQDSLKTEGVTMISKDFWRPVLIAQIPLLLNLRDVVLQLSHTRLPKWRFRLDLDLVVQIQPRPAERRDRYFLFEGLAIYGDKIARESFLRRNPEHRRLNFGILPGSSASGPGWLFKPTCCPRKIEDAYGLRSLVLAGLIPERFEQLSSAMMLSDHCMICGKHLTDPASMGRMIGPECAHDSSLLLPRVRDVA